MAVCSESSNCLENQRTLGDPKFVDGQVETMEDLYERTRTEEQVATDVFKERGRGSSRHFQMLIRMNNGAASSGKRDFQ